MDDDQRDYLQEQYPPPGLPGAELRQGDTQTLMQRYTPNLGKYLPDTWRNFFLQAMQAPAALGWRGPAMAGRARQQGLTPQDFDTAMRLDKRLPTALIGRRDAGGNPQPVPIDPGFVEGRSLDPYASPALTPYERALAQQELQSQLVRTLPGQGRAWGRDPAGNSNKAIRPGEYPYQIADDPYTMAQRAIDFMDRVERGSRNQPPPDLKVVQGDKPEGRGGGGFVEPMQQPPPPREPPSPYRQLIDQLPQIDYPELQNPDLAGPPSRLKDKYEPHSFGLRWNKRF